VNEAKVEQYILEHYPTGHTGLKVFYEKNGYQTAWISLQNRVNLEKLIAILDNASYLGLREKDYPIKLIKTVNAGTARLSTNTDSLETEILITESAIRYFEDIAYGNGAPPLGYNGLENLPTHEEMAALLATHLSNNTLPLFISQLSSTIQEISTILQKIKEYLDVMAKKDFTEINISSNQLNQNNKPLIKKLQQLGILDSANNSPADSILLQKIQQAQIQFNEPEDKTIRPALLTELNVPLSVRHRQLTLSLNYFRWLSRYLDHKPLIVVNIPAAYLKVYQHNAVLIEMRMIVGKKSTPTPTLASIVNEVILYPYWHVPYKIATRELLPSIKRNPAYLDAGNYQVLNSAGKILNPYSIRWHAYSSRYFPFIIRQSTGCDNALGLLKLNFYNPFSVYLHDTPSKDLFGKQYRFFSHGCMRMEKPMELGHLLLKNNSIAIDTLEQKGCLHNQSPIIIPAVEAIPVIVWYNPAGLDAMGRLVYYRDIYEKFNWMQP
jgi:murein L,D-transpeptidase YcbB/YkuD